jgi:FG-GAP-like repeat
MRRRRVVAIALAAAAPVIACDRPTAPAAGSATASSIVPAAAEPIVPLGDDPMAVVTPLPPDAWQALPQVTLIEEMVLYVDETTAELRRSLQNRALPDPPLSRLGLFAEAVIVNDVAGRGEPAVSQVSGVARRSYSLTKSRRVARADLALWKPMLTAMSRVERVAMGVKDAGFLRANAARQRGFRSHHAFELVGTSSDEGRLAYSGDLVIDWRLEANESAVGTRWLIERFELRSLDSMSTAHAWFDDVSDHLLTVGTLARATGSLHEEKVARYLADLSKPPTPFFKVESHDRHPALSVVDVDADGIDELYVMGRWGANMLLQRQDDGRWHDVAKAWGLDLRDHCTAALFADYDNDGDPDLFLGRSQAPAVYLHNEGGRFREAAVGLDLPDRVASLAAADYDNDGRLDLHIATYAHQLPPDRSFHALSHAELGGLRQNSVIDAIGPANVLLHNDGPKAFSDATKTAGVLVHRHSFQATWGDYDDDGDPDLYVANDYAPNVMLRNDGGRFVDATADTNTADQGFGMAATWGDYDLDGRQDLYVANMFSKAGRRIMNKLPGLDPRFRKMAAGNTLFRNEGASGFSRASPTVPVAETGWSWGSLFTDVDNDGALDLAVLNGYFTAPRALAKNVDS